MAELSPLIAETLKSCGEVTLTITGSSMLPMLRHRRDKVRLIKPPEDGLRKYDIPLYMRPDDTYILHRIVEIRKNGYVTAGDHQRMKEYGITHAQVLGVVRGFWRNGVYISCDHIGYRIYSMFWGGCFWFRKLYLAAEAFGRLFGRKI